MTTQSASITSPSASTATRSASAISARPPRSITERWLFAGFLLAGAAQLITISALVRSIGPLAASWSALLLAIAPVLLAAAAAFRPAGLARPAAAAAAVALLVGIVGSLVAWHSWNSHPGVLFVPALVAVVVGGTRLWRARTP